MKLTGCLPPLRNYFAFLHAPRANANMGNKPSSLPLHIGVAAALGFAGVYGFAGEGNISAPQTISQITQTGCNIKGNISMNTGERIYHVPGQRYYHDTRIETHKGERWFCSEAEAMAAGWRRSRV